MAKAFTKGQKVTHLGSYDGKGTFYFRHAVVHSCGVKQMTLTDEETGWMMGRNFAPALGDAEGFLPGTFPRMSDEEAVALGARMAERFLTHERERFASARSRAEDQKFEGYEGYIRSMHKQEAELHAPRVAPLAVLRAETIARMRR